MLIIQRNGSEENRRRNEKEMSTKKEINGSDLTIKQIKGMETGRNDDRHRIKLPLLTGRCSLKD